MPATEQALARLREQLDKIVNADHTPKLVRPSLGELNFEEYNSPARTTDIAVSSCPHRGLEGLASTGCADIQ